MRKRLRSQWESFVSEKIARRWNVHIVYEIEVLAEIVERLKSNRFVIWEFRSELLIEDNLELADRLRRRPLQRQPTGCQL